jgi:hypothetical protein
VKILRLQVPRGCRAGRSTGLTLLLGSWLQASGEGASGETGAWPLY